MAKQDFKRSAAAYDRLTPQPWKTFVQPLRLSRAAGVAALPRRSSLHRHPRRASHCAVERASADRVWNHAGHEDITKRRGSPGCCCLEA